MQMFVYYDCFSRPRKNIYCCLFRFNNILPPPDSILPRRLISRHIVLVWIFILQPPAFYSGATPLSCENSDSESAATVILASSRSSSWNDFGEAIFCLSRHICNAYKQQQLRAISSQQHFQPLHTFMISLLEKETLNSFVINRPKTIQIEFWREAM